MHFFKFISSSNFQNKKAFKGTIHIYSNNMIITSELIGTELILCNFKRLATYTASSVYSLQLFSKGKQNQILFDEIQARCCRARLGKLNTYRSWKVICESKVHQRFWQNSDFCFALIKSVRKHLQKKKWKSAIFEIDENGYTTDEVKCLIYQSKL